MKSWKSFCFALLAVALLCGAFFLGRFTARETGPQSGGAVSFHAEILERDGMRFHVNGLDCNDINSRGEFTFSVNEDTPLVWRGTALTLDDLEAGDRIMVTYSGEALETYPVQLPDVYRINLLEDEKKTEPAERTGVSFQAEILERDGTRVHVNGLDENDRSHRGRKLVFSVRDDTPLSWRGTEITLDDLEAGDRIKVTYSGAVMESYPGQIPDVYRIDLLEDEK